MGRGGLREVEVREKNSKFSLVFLCCVIFIRDMYIRDWLGSSFWPCGSVWVASFQVIVRGLVGERGSRR